MKYYICCFGVSVEAPGFEPLRDYYKGRFHELRSYWELKKRKHHAPTINVYGNDYFLDSGAFSAKMLSVDIGVEEYGNFVKQHWEQIPFFANLDAIPKSDSSEDMELGAKQTWRNQKDLESMTGMIPLPVFHKGEPVEYLERYLKEYEYVCIGGLMNSSCSNREFFDMVWKMNRKYGKVWRKIHGFGISNLKTLKRYPWHSSDSSSWLRSATCGVILVPTLGRNGNYDFLKLPSICPISDRATGRQHWKKKHFDFLTQEQKTYVLKYLESLGLTLKDMRGLNCGRMIANVNYWVEFEKQYNLQIGVPKETRQIFLLD